MSFLDLVRNSIFNPHFYRSLFERSFSFSFKYFLALVVILAVILTAVLSLRLIPAFYIFINDIMPEVLHEVSDEMVVVIRDGEVSTNVEEPFIVPVPESSRHFNRRVVEALGLENIFVIDTQNPAAAEEFARYNTLILMTRDSLVAGVEEDFDVMRLHDIESLVINKSVVEEVLESILARMRWIAPMFVFALFFVLMIAGAGVMAYLLFGALIVMIVSMIKKIDMNYKRAYRIALHAATLPLIVQVMIIAVGLPWIPFLFTVLFTVMVAVNLQKDEEVSEKERLPLPISP